MMETETQADPYHETATALELDRETVGETGGRSADTVRRAVWHARHAEDLAAWRPKPHAMYPNVPFPYFLAGVHAQLAAAWADIARNGGRA